MLTKRSELSRNRPTQDRKNLALAKFHHLLLRYLAEKNIYRHSLSFGADYRISIIM